MKDKKRCIFAGILVLFAFSPIYLWGPNPYTGFLFVAFNFMAGTSTRPQKEKEKINTIEVIEAIRGVLVLVIICVAMWISGEENFSKVIRNPVFLIMCCGWFELTILIRYQEHKLITHGQPSVQPDSLKLAG